MSDTVGYWHKQPKISPVKMCIDWNWSFISSVPVSLKAKGNGSAATFEHILFYYFVMLQAMICAIWYANAKGFGIYENNLVTIQII